MAVNENLKYLGEEFTRCINCGSPNFKVSLYVYEAPLAGTVLIECGVCYNCNYRKSDVSMLTFGEPRTMKMVVKSPDDLKVMVVKSSTATVDIPELGIEILPGVAAYGYLTTIEGILEKVLEVIPQDCYEREECVEKVNLIKEAMNGSIPFTLIIKDPLGRSAIMSDNVEIIDEEEKCQSST